LNSIGSSSVFPHSPSACIISETEEGERERYRVEREVEKGWRAGNRREKSGREGWDKSKQRRRERKYVERDGKGRDEVERS
jgi:hypothetical protein